MSIRRVLRSAAAVAGSVCCLAFAQETQPAAAAPAPAPEATGAEAAPAPAPAAPGSIRGTAKSMPWNEPLPEAAAALDGTSLNATTDAQGNFELKGVPPGTYQLTVTFPSHKSAVVPVTVKPGEAAAVTAELTLEDIRGEEIVIVGSKFPEKRMESPVTVEVVRPKEIQMMGASSYLAALSQVKGVDFTDNGISEKRISARGFNTQFNSRMLFMVDGRLATLPGNGLPQGALLPTSSLDIHNVEVVVGPAAALYGPNAHTGVVNVITKTPWDETGAQLSLRGGTQAVLDGSARVAGTVNKSFGYKLTGQLMRGNEWVPAVTDRSFTYGTAAIPVAESSVVGAYEVFSGKMEGFGYYRAGDWNVKAGAGWSTNTGFSATNLGRNHLRGWQVQFQTAQVASSNWYAQVTRTVMDAGNTYQIDRIAGLVAAAGGRTQTEEQLNAWKDQFKFVDRSSLIDSELQYRNELGPLKLVAGGGWRLYQPVSDGTYLADVNGRKLSSMEGGVYAQADYALLPEKLKLIGAVRLDLHSDYSPQFSPKAAVVYTVADNQNLRLTYNRAFKSPTLLENYLLVSNSFLGNKTGFILKDAAGAELSRISPLVPEQVDSVEVGYKGTLVDRLFVDAVGYHSWYRNFISALTPRANGTTAVAYYADTGEKTALGTPQEGQLLTYSNFGAAQVLGIDVGADYQLIPQASINASASFIRMYSFQNNDPTLRALLLNVPQFKVRGGLTVEDLVVDNSFLRLTGRYQAAYEFASGRWISANFYADRKIPARFVADLGVGYRFKNGLKLSANLFNMFDDKGVDVLGAPAGGRFLFGQIEYDFDGLDY